MVFRWRSRVVVVACALFCTTTTKTICSALLGVVPLSLGTKSRTSINTQQQQKLPAISFAKIKSWKQKDATTNGEVNSGDPSHWFSDTEPFFIVRYFARPEVTDAEIKKVLKANAIGSLTELKKKTGCVIPLLLPDAISSIGAAVINALHRIRKTAEEVLGEAKIVFDQTCISQAAYDMYAPGAVSVFPDKFQLTSKNRYPDFSLVMGSSGSGKTLFAMRRIPQLRFGINDESKYFGIHFCASEVTRVMKGNSDKKPRKKITFPEAVATIVKDVIATKLSGKGLEGVKTLDIPIHITIDEAGGSVYKQYFDTADKIQSIVAAIKAEGTFGFQQAVHVTVAGTRLETSTDEITTTLETTKFRMQPWKAMNFDAFVDKAAHSNPFRVKEVVHGFPILEDLVSNARCAFFVVENLRNELFLRENRIKSYVTVLVSLVADSYISSNGLFKLQSPETKWKVARSVFREVDKSSQNKGKAFFPQFEDLERESLRSVASSLLDVNVETEGKVPILADGFEFSVSMTQALAIVVASLLSADAKVSWDWQGFETSVMLSEMKRMVVTLKDIPSSLNRLLLQLPSPVPAPNAKKTFKVPVVDKNTVVLNGPKAKYADVIAPYRLVQTKFSTENTKPLTLDLQDELNKMGLTHSKNHVLQQWVTTVFRKFWDLGEEGPSWIPGKSLVNLVNKKNRQEYYPFNTLNSKIVLENPKMVEAFEYKGKWVICVRSIGKEDGKELSRKGRKKGSRKRDDKENRIDWDAAFIESCPVTAVFATNCIAFKFTVTRERLEGSETVEYEDKIIITQDDVTWDGTWTKSEGDEFAKLGLRDGVEIRFLFC